MTQDEIKQRATSIERHTQTILVLVLVAILLWVGGTTQQTAVHIAAMNVKIEQLQEEVRKPDGKFTNIEGRLDVIERQLQDLIGQHKAEGSKK